MKATLKIINRYYWKSIFGPGILFLFSILYIYVISNAWSLFGMLKSVSVIPTAMAMITSLVGLFCIPITINTLRQSVLMRRIGVSNISPFMFMFTIIVYYGIMIALSYIWIFVWCFAFYAFKMNEYTTLLTSIDWGGLIFAILINYLLSISIGMFILIFTKRNYVITIIATIITIMNFLLSGYAAPLPLIHSALPDYKTGTFYVVYIDPFWYTSAMNYEAAFSHTNNFFNFYGTSIFNPMQKMMGKTITTTTEYKEVILFEFDKCLNLFLPISMIAVFGSISGFNFKWNIR